MMIRYLQNKTPVPKGMVQIPGFPRYYVNLKGQVWSQCSGGYLKDIGSKNYSSIGLYEGAKKAYWSKAKILLTTFVRLPAPKEVARHLDDDNSNNDLSNLAWGTIKQNGEDSVRNGKRPRGADHWKSKLQPLDVVNILINCSKREDKIRFANMYKIVTTTIYSICAGESWKHIYEIVKEHND